MPRFAGPLALLQPDDVLTVACLMCDHHARIEVRSLARHIATPFTVAMLEGCLCCTQCGERGSAELVAIGAKGLASDADRLAGERSSADGIRAASDAGWCPSAAWWARSASSAARLGHRR
jgi:hypothetical protein